MLTNPDFSKVFWTFSKMDKNKCPKSIFQNTFGIGVLKNENICF
jgi:hypothetical protein